MTEMFVWNFVCETLGTDWEALDLAEFIHTKDNQAGRRRHLFWLVFAALTWILWTTRNKLVIERVFH